MTIMDSLIWSWNNDSTIDKYKIRLATLDVCCQIIGSLVTKRSIDDLHLSSYHIGAAEELKKWVQSAREHYDKSGLTFNGLTFKGQSGSISSEEAKDMKEILSIAFQ